MCYLRNVTKDNLLNTYENNKILLLICKHFWRDYYWNRECRSGQTGSGQWGIDGLLTLEVETVNEFWQSYGQSLSGGLVGTGKQSDRWHNRRW